MKSRMKSDQHKNDNNTLKKELYQQENLTVKIKKNDAPVEKR